MTPVGSYDWYRASMRQLVSAAFDGQVTVAQVDRRIRELICLHLLSAKETHDGT